MEKAVEGPWKAFTFRMLGPEDAPDIFEHMRNNFYRDEPLCKLLGYDEDSAEDFDRCIAEILPEKLSFAAVHTLTGKFAGVRLTTISRRNGHEHSKEEMKCKSEKTVKIRGLLTEVTILSNVFEKFGVDEYGDYFMTSVDKEFRGQGLVTEMYIRSISLLKARGFQLAKSVFTSPFTRKAAEKLGFQELARLKFTDFIDTDGSRPFSHGDPDDFASVMALQLRTL